MARGLSEGFDGCDGLGDKGIVHAVHVHGFADSSGKRDAEASAEVFAEIAEAAQYLQFAVGLDERTQLQAGTGVGRCHSLSTENMNTLHDLGRDRSRFCAEREGHAPDEASPA